MIIPVIYIAGPFRGENAWEIECNIRRAETLSLEVWRAGGAALCPHTNTRFFQGAAPDEIWLSGTLELLRRCDAVLMTADWRRSSGARTEHDEAERRKMPVFYEESEGVAMMRSFIKVFANARAGRILGWDDGGRG